MDINTYAFIIRIWHEEGDDGERPAHWRGSIDHVGANQRLYFCELDGAIRFIQEQIGVGFQSHTPWWQKLGRCIRREIFKMWKFGDKRSGG